MGLRRDASCILFVWPAAATAKNHPRAIDVYILFRHDGNEFGCELVHAGAERSL
jgi:hypothetical protein